LGVFVLVFLGGGGWVGVGWFFGGGGLVCGGLARVLYLSQVIRSPGWVLTFFLLGRRVNVRRVSSRPLILELVAARSLQTWP